MFIIAIMCRVGMKEDGREHAGLGKKGFATQRDMPEHFPCARLEHG